MKFIIVFLAGLVTVESLSIQFKNDTLILPRQILQEDLPEVSTVDEQNVFELIFKAKSRLKSL